LNSPKEIEYSSFNFKYKLYIMQFNLTKKKVILLVFILMQITVLIWFLIVENTRSNQNEILIRLLKGKNASNYHQVDYK
jgi:hypothetical protein